MLRRTLVMVAGALTLACGVAGPAGAGAVARPGALAAADACPDARAALLAFNASRAWTVAGTKGIGVTIGVVGAPDRVAEAVCAARALAPEATVRSGPAGAIVVVADTSVDPGSIGGGALVVAAAGDASGPMSARPQGIVNVAAADSSGAPLSTSSSGPAVTVAAYGNDTSTASGYVAALAAILRAGHGNWPARQVVAQEAGSINPYSGSPHTDQLGFGVINPVQAVSLPAVDPASLPGFDAMFPVNQPPQTASASPRSQQTSAPSGTPTASSSVPATATDSASASQPSTTSTPTVTDSGNLWPTGALSSSGPSNVSQTAAAKSGGSGGVSPVLYIGLLVLLGGGGYVLWQRRRQPLPVETKPQEEWDAPTGPRHSGYSPPDE